MYNIALIPGDGIGPEVIEEGKKVIELACQLYGTKINWHNYPFGAQYYLSKGQLLPDSALTEMADMDAIYFGAIGDPSVQPGILEREILLKMRFTFDQYINLRPVRLFPGILGPLRYKDHKDINFYVVRENTEDFYVGIGDSFQGDRYQKEHSLVRKLVQMDIDLKFRLSKEEEVGYQLGLLTRGGSERIIKYAFELARQKSMTKVSTVDKLNVLSGMYRLWRDVFGQIATGYPEIATDYYYVDAMTMFFVSQPERFQVIVSPNMFGDIITDLGATIQGGIGMAAGANINPEGISMFEPIHGSAPDLKNKSVANPIGTILAGAMMMEHLGEKQMAHTIEQAVEKVLGDGIVKTIDMGGDSNTVTVGREICKELSKI